MLYNLSVLAQQVPVLKSEKPQYNRKEEIIYFGKRYGIYNNYVTLGAGFLNSSIRQQSQKNIGLDFQFHIRRQDFQMGVMMSGPNFGDNNNIQAHICYGLRRERNTSNLAAYIGPSYFTGVQGVSGSPAIFYDGFGVYGCVQAVSKFWYDIGLGVEIFGDVSYKQAIYGFRVIAFFSNAYRGPKKNFNPNVRSENPQ